MWNVKCKGWSVECSNATRLKCCACHTKWRQRSPTCCPSHENCNSSCENDAKVLRLPHKTTFDTLSNRLECHKVLRLPRKTALQLAWKPSKRKGFAASPVDTARPQENQRLETRHKVASKRAFRARLPPIFALCSFKIDVFLRVFLGTSKFATSKSMFRARLPSISSHLTKCHACHGICTLSPLDTALTMRFAKTRHTTRLKCCACHAKWRLRMVADGSATSSEHTLSPDPQSDTGTLATHSGKILSAGHLLYMPSCVKISTQFLVLSLAIKSVYLFLWKRNELTEKLYWANHSVFSSSLEVYSHLCF